MTREDDNLSVFNWDDSKSILYGSENSKMFYNEESGGKLQFGGMSQSTDVFQQLAENMWKVNLESKGRWRIFSKLGFGYTSIRNRYEVTLVGYTWCGKLRE